MSHNAVIEYDNQQATKVTIDGHELDCIAGDPTIDIATDENYPSFLTVTIALNKFELARYLPDGHSLTWEQKTKIGANA